MNGWKALIAVAAFSVLGGTAAFAQTLEPIGVPQENQNFDKATTLPAAPTLLTVQAVSTTRVALLWQDTSNNESEFQVEGRVSGSTTFLPLGTTPASSPAAFVSSLDPNTVYEF